MHTLDIPLSTTAVATTAQSAASTDTTTALATPAQSATTLTATRSTTTLATATCAAQPQSAAFPSQQAALCPRTAQSPSTAATAATSSAQPTPAVATSATTIATHATASLTQPPTLAPAQPTTALAAAQSTDGPHPLATTLSTPAQPATTLAAAALAAALAAAAQPAAARYAACPTRVAALAAAARRSAVASTAPTTLALAPAAPAQSTAAAFTNSITSTNATNATHESATTLFPSRVATLPTVAALAAHAAAGPGAARAALLPSHLCAHALEPYMFTFWPIAFWLPRHAFGFAHTGDAYALDDAGVGGFEGLDKVQCSVFYASGCALYRDLFLDLASLGAPPTPPPPPMRPVAGQRRLQPTRIFFAGGPSENMAPFTTGSLGGDALTEESAPYRRTRVRRELQGVDYDDTSEIIDASDDPVVLDACTGGTEAAPTLCETQGYENAVRSATSQTHNHKSISYTIITKLTACFRLRSGSHLTLARRRDSTPSQLCSTRSPSRRRRHRYHSRHNPRHHPPRRRPRHREVRPAQCPRRL